MKISRMPKAVYRRYLGYRYERKGWKTNRKVVVIESDDWGSIRMPDKKTYSTLLKKGIKVDRCQYNKYDTLASNDDLSALYEVLRKHKDSKGNHPIITANTIVGNPDFDKIEHDNYLNYYYEPFTETLKRYPNRDFKMWREGMREKLFYPQLHGREHLNIGRWMRIIQSRSKETMISFENRMFGISTSISKENRRSYMAALDYEPGDEHIAIRSIVEGYDLFNKIFKYKSDSFIGPNYYWDANIESQLSQKGIKYLQGGFSQNLPGGKKKYHFLGEKNKYDQIYLVRNVIFEPASGTKDWVGSSMKQIEQAFSLQKPAIICAHRVNFIGSIFEENRTENLAMLSDLLSKILQKWPDVEFMHSAQLGDLIISN